MNCDRREVFTVHVSTENIQAPQTACNFTTYIDIPLRNVVKAELLMASLAPSDNTSALAYIYIPELQSKFYQRAMISTNVSVAGLTTAIGAASGAFANVGLINNSFAALPFDSTSYLNGSVGRLIYNKNNNFPTEHEYIEPIRQLKQLTIQIYKTNGSLMSTGGANNFFTFRFECAKDNVCMY
jgi:hypothetical protein